MTFDADKVRDIAAAQVDERSGAALCVVVNGVEVLNEAWGTADAGSGAPYTTSTLQIVQSMGKGVIGAVAALLIGRGQLDPDARVCSYWPEFGTPDKRDITVRQLLSHQTGLLYLDATMPLELTLDRPALAAALVAQPPAWQPGTRVGYSPQTFGNYADFLFERACGKGFAGLLGEINESLSVEMYVGLPAAQRHRAATAVAAEGGAIAEPQPELAAAFADPESLLMRMMRNIPGTLPDPMPLVNGDALKDAFLPAANMFTSARSLAVLYGALNDALSGRTGGLWSRDGVETATAEAVRGTDAVLQTEASFGLGFQKPSSTYPFSPSPRSFGHGGAGGSLAMADPDAGVAMSWIPSRYGTEAFDARQAAVVDAVYAALD